MKKTIRRFLRRAAAILAAAGVFAGTVPVFAAGTFPELGRVSGTWTLDMWHYSGGYWKVGNKGSEAIRVEDKDIKALDSYLQANNKAVFTVDAPAEIVQLVRDGGRGTDWQVAFADYRGRDCSLLFVESSPADLAVTSGGELSFSATPVFHFNNSGASLRDYVPGMSVTVPLVDKAYGCNIYSVFGNGLSAVQGRGYYSEADPSDLGSNAIHPSMILGKSGALEAGHPITLGGRVVDSAGYTIGSGTFAAAGACGLHFEFPVSLVFTDLRPQGPGDDPGSGTEPGTDPGGDGPGEDPSDPTDPAEDPETVTSVDACLDLPERAYAGHDVAARDESVYVVDGQAIGAARAAELGVGSGKFALVPAGAGRIRKNGRTGAIAVFENPGTFQVKLTATAANGLKDTDTKSIEILKTPSILADLGGVQKENRKQKLVVTVAQDPRHPVNELSIVLTDAASGESIRVDKAFGGKEAAPVNTAHIKYRSLQDAGSDACFLCVELDFLTKWHETRTLSYEIRAKDSAGGTDTVLGTFDVTPDLPPQAEIGLEDVYYRREGGGDAAITVCCASSSDGDALQRTWQYKGTDGNWQDAAAMPGFTDLSFGSGQQVQFGQAGVGAFDVRLTVKDLWVEETLPEYVTDADRLSASAQASSRVDNVAPRVGLDLLRTEAAELFVLTESDTARRDVLAAAPGLKAALLAEGIALEVRADFRQAGADDETGALTELTTGGHGAGNYRDSDQLLYSGAFSGMWDGGNLVCDGRYSYLLSPTVQTYPADPRYSIHTYPFTITARDAAGQTVWTTAVTRQILDSQTNLRDASWGFDADGTYLYLTEGGRTALFDIRTGTYVGTLDQALGAFNLVTPEALYTFKDSGVYRMPKSGGALRCVFSGEIFCPVSLGGGVQFLLKADLGKGLGLYRGQFDPQTGSMRCSLLEGSLEGYAADAEILASDASGAFFVRTESSIYCFGADDLLIRVIPLRVYGRAREVFPVWSGDGRVRWIAQTGTAKSSRYEVWCRCSGVYTDEVFDDRVVSNDDYPNYGKPVVFAAEDETGAIGVYLGCDYVYGTSERYTERVLFRFNGTFQNPLGFSMEHGYRSIRYICTTANLGGTSDLKQIVHVAESRADEEARLKAKHLTGTKSYRHELSLDGPQTPQSLETAMNSAAQAILAMKEQGTNAAVLSGTGELSRAVSLAPDTTYYYEYETTAETDILSVQAELTRPDGMPAQAGGYRVTAAYTENFDDKKTDAFFTLDSAVIAGGSYRIGELKTKETASIRVQTGTSHEVRFRVPTGSLGILELDYAFQSASQAPGAKQLTLSRDDGPAQTLEIVSAGLTTGSGRYLHPVFLEPGEYALNSVLRERTKEYGREGVFRIDNLKVMLAAEGAADGSAGLQVLAAQSSAAGEGTLRRVTGSFTTPQQTAHFGVYPCRRVTGLQNQFVRLAVDARGTRKEASLTFEIPEDRTVLYAYASGTGKPSVYTNSSGKKRYYDARWNWNSELQGIHTKESNGLLTLYELPNPARFFWRALTGSHVLTGLADTYYGADVSIDSAVLYVSEAGTAVPPALREGRFLEKDGQLYAEDLVFSGRGLVSFAVQDGTVVRNLRVYSVSGGSEVTALTCAFRGESDLDGWGGETASAVIAPFAIQKEEPARVYAKGETIRYQVFYGDYEHDPGKKQHWVYTHEALTDGPFPQAGTDLSSPVTKFYVDGKYTATHWQEDDTGNPAYDKESNKVEITFYINSGPGSGAPWVKSIRTDPAAVRAGDVYTVRAAVDDSDKDPLTVTVEVYKDQGSQPVGKKTVRGLKPDASGRYPDVVLSGLPAAAAGTYDIVVSVKDDDGADVDTLRFRVKEERSLTGTVTHTAAWEANRLAWNEAMQGTDAVRPENMFWPGEMLVLNAPCTGDPVSVDAQIREFPQYAARLTRGAAGTDGKPVYTGQLWHSSMLTVIGTARPVPATVRFTAQYADGSKLTWDVAIVFDQSRGSYYQLHRTY